MFDIIGKHSLHVYTSSICPYKNISQVAMAVYPTSHVRVCLSVLNVSEYRKEQINYDSPEKNVLLALKYFKTQWLSRRV